MESKLSDAAGIFYQQMRTRRVPGWVSGDLAIPQIDGKYVLNLTERDIYVTTIDGFTYRVRPIKSVEEKETVLRQMYIVFGAFKSSYPNVESDIEPMASCGNHRHYHKPNGYTMMPTGIKKRLAHAYEYFMNNTVYDDSEPTGVLSVSRGEYYDYANIEDSHNEITDAIRNGANKVFVFRPMNIDGMQYNISANDQESTNIETLVGHTSIVGNNNDIDESMPVCNRHGHGLLMSDIIRDKISSFYYTEIEPGLMEMQLNGYYIPQFGLTLDTSSKMENKAASIYAGMNQEYISRWGIRIIAPINGSKYSKLYARFGHMPIVLIPSPHHSINQNGNIIIMMMGVDGVERMMCSVPLEDAVRDGASFKTPFGDNIHIPFFTSTTEMYAWNDTESAQAIKELENKLLAQQEANTKLKEEYAKAEKKRLDEEAKRMKEKTGFFTSFIHSTLINPKTAAWLGTLIVTVVLAVIPIVKAAV